MRISLFLTDKVPSLLFPLSIERVSINDFSLLSFDSLDLFDLISFYVLISSLSFLEGLRKYILFF
jgi:hypothetical protein